MNTLGEKRMCLPGLVPKGTGVRKATPTKIEQSAAGERLSAGTNRVLATAAHELRNPISAMITLAEMLWDEASDHLTSLERDLVSGVLSSGRLALNLSEDLLDVTYERGRILRLATEDLLAIVKESMVLNQPLAERQHVRLALCVESPPAPLQLDRLKCIRVVNELLSNALRGSPPDTTVTVTVGTHNRFAKVSIRDEGIGIAPQDLAKLFEPFPKLTATNAPSDKHGRGLGLAIVKATMDAHKGQVRVTSKVDVGTVVVVTFPTKQG